MAPNLAILTTLTLLLFSGCIGGPDAQTTAAAPPAEGPADQGAPQDAAPGDEPAQQSQPPQPPSEAPGCKANGNNSNYGIYNSIGDVYVVSPRGGNLLIVYEEQNGRRGLQTEGECPTNPDLKVAEVPDPVPATLALNA